MPRLERFTPAYLDEGSGHRLDFGEIDAWLDSPAAHLKDHSAFAIMLGRPVRTDTWSAAQVKEGITDGAQRLTDMTSLHTDPVGARVTSQVRDTGWLPQSPQHGFGAQGIRSRCARPGPERSAELRARSGGPLRPPGGGPARCAGQDRVPESIRTS
ncbi:hypothetical protein ABZS88_46620 [Streptomyces sp. NPDC005480]|uniref:hypothetical protein n=1 Tax=Streptomyces sp. NPDC005480 TaxID=3154880 RepID=UPI00339FF851